MPKQKKKIKAWMVWLNKINKPALMLTYREYVSMSVWESRHEAEKHRDSYLKQEVAKVVPITTTLNTKYEKK